MTAVPMTPLAQRLVPAHLQPDADAEQLAAARAAVPLEAPPVDRSKDPRAQEQWPFDLDYVDPAGKRWQGKFVTKILSNRELMWAGNRRAQLHGHQPLIGFDELSLQLSLVVSRLEFCLVEAPDWAKKLWELTSYDVLWAVYAKVSEHEEFFRGPPRGAGASGGAAGGEPAASFLGGQAPAAG